VKFFWIPFLIALALAIGLFLVGGPFLFWGTPAGFIAALVTLAGALACVKAYRDPDVETDSRNELTRSNVTFATVAAGLILFAYAMLAPTVLVRAREYSKTEVSVCNLGAVGAAMKLYADDTGDYPSSPGDLVRAGHATGAEFQSLQDPRAPGGPPPGGPIYSSFVLQPGSGKWNPDSRLILAYERFPWTITELRLFAAHGRLVLFGDGKVRRLDDWEFEAARQADSDLRKELAWRPPAAD